MLSLPPTPLPCRGLIPFLLLLAIGVTLTACPSQSDPEPRPTPVEPQPEPDPEPEPPAPCPPIEAREIAKNDPVVQEAMDEAWRRSKEGTAEEHEESFWVVQRRSRDSQGEWDYQTDIVWDPPGKHESSGGTNKPRVSGGRIVLHHHTHPGPAGEAEPGHCYNECASEADELNVEKTGVPSTYSFGSGPDPKKTTTHIVTRPDGTPLERPTNPNWECPPPEPGSPPQPGPGATPPAGPPECADCARSTGDPHLRTHDGVRYDLQAAGEFDAVVIDGEPLLQLRFEPWGSSRRVSITTAAAMRVGNSRVSIRPGIGLYVDGAAVELQPRDHGLTGRSVVVMAQGRFPPFEEVTLDLPGGGKIERFGSDYVVDWPDGSRAWVQVSGSTLGVFFEPSAPLVTRLSGLFGDGDGDPTNDFTSRSGTRYPDRPSFEELYGDFAESWRVDEGQSLFDYAAGEGPDAFTDRSMPEEAVTVDGLPPDERREAERICREAGVEGEEALEECILDVALTGDADFARAARAVDAIRQPPSVRYTQFEGLARSAGEDGYRITYEHRDRNSSSTMTVISDPPREALVIDGNRMIYDGTQTVSCSGSGDGERCLAVGYEKPTAGAAGFGGFGGFGMREDPSELAEWLEQEPSSIERVERRSLLGRDAVCKITEVPGAMSTTTCYETELGVLLSMRILMGPEQTPQVEMVATEFGRPREEDFRLPEDVRRVETD